MSNLDYSGVLVSFMLAYAMFSPIAGRGVGEAGNLPACIKIVAERVPAGLRTLAIGVLNVGAGLGAIVAPPVVVWLMLQRRFAAPGQEMASDSMSSCRTMRNLLAPMALRIANSC